MYKVKLRDICGFVYAFFMFSVFIFPEYLAYKYEALSQVVSYLFWCCIFVVLSRFALNIKRNVKKLKGCYIPVLMVLTYEFYYLLLTFISYGEYGSVISQGLRAICMCLLVFDILTSKSKGMIKGAILFFEIIVYITLILQILYPEGLYNFNVLMYNKRVYCFVGHQNTVLRSILPGIILSLVKSYSEKKHITARAWILLLSSFVLLLLLNSTTSFVSLGLSIICLIIFGFKRERFELFTYRTAIIGFLIFFVLIVLIGNVSIFTGFIENTLHKSTDFSGRVYAWDRAIVGITQNPIFGHGYQDNELGYFFWNTSDSNRSCHNIVLDILYRTGIIGFALFVMMLFSAASIIDKKNNELSKILTIIAISYLVSWNFDPFVDNEFCFALMPVMISVFSSSDYCNLSSKDTNNEHSRVVKLRRY